MAIFDVVKFDGLKSRDWIVYKHPSEQLVFGTQLIVQEGQVAIFFKGGNVCDVFYSGTYTLNADNLPILKHLVNIPFGGRTPFTAEIYFINTLTKMDLFWGTPDPIQLIDPKYYVRLHIRAFGQMALKLMDYSVFFQELIGSVPLGDVVRYDKIIDFYRGILILKVKTEIAKTITERQISALEITSKLDEISASVESYLSKEFAKYGFSVVNFLIKSINFPDEDLAQVNKILEEKARFNILGEQHYATSRSFDVYESAANNSSGVSGAFAASGLGFGAAMSMGTSMGHIVGNPMQNVNSAQNVVGNSSLTKECPKCHDKVSENVCFCSSCGFNFAKMICECGQKLDVNSKFCSGCGKKVNFDE